MRGAARVLSVAAIALAAVAVRDAAGRAQPYSLAAAGIVGCPPGGRSVPAGAGLQVAIDSARQGAVLCLVPGSYRGPVVIYRRLTLWGPPDAVVVSDGEGTTIRALADGVVLRGFAVRGSGRRYDKMDAAVYVHGSHVEVRDLAVARALFGIVVEQSDSVTIAGNHVVGLAELPVGIRGDGIRLWEVRHSDVVGNRLEDSRDILVWYSPDDRIVDNTVVRSRYGTHFMYSDGSSVEGADYRANIVGVFVMYSRGVTVRRSTFADNVEADAMGLGVKESGDLVVDHDLFLNAGACLYLDTSPFRKGDSVLVQHSSFIGCSSGVTFHSSERDNAFIDNTFQANQVHVAIEGRGTALGVEWRGNYFDDYQGYDLDGDGIGDVPYEVRDLSERLLATHPGLAFFRGTAVLELLDLAGRALPMLEPEALLIDPVPRMAPDDGNGKWQGGT